MIWFAANGPGAEGVLRQAIFWSVAVAGGWLQMILVARGVRASFGADKWPGWALLLATALIGAVPLTFEVRWLMETIVAPPAGLPPPWVTYLNVGVINTVFCFVQFVLIERWPLFGSDIAAQQAASAGQPAAPALSEGDPPFVGKLSRRPEGLNGTILYMQMEDHYLRVVTDAGQGMALHRMSDARRDLEGTDGLQVHKSWWVSRSAIARIRRENRKRVIAVTDGTEIPVGRSFERDLREAGWI